ncbi:MAG: hypothetical protein ACO1SX_09105 [Actinomycetota bacterium]
MKTTVGMICAAAVLSLLNPASAQDNKGFAKDTPVVVVGRISSPPSGAINERKMQVAIGPAKTDYTLHFRKATVLGLRGQKLDEDGLDDGMWVRAEGRMMGDPRRVEVTRVQVIAPDDKEHPRSAFYRAGYDFGYITAVAGTREIFPARPAGAAPGGAPFVIVGRVSDDTGPFETTRRLQVNAAGNTWTLHVPKDTPVMDATGKKISVHEINQDQWVRAYGWRSDDLRMRVERLENVGKDEAFRSAAFYRKDYPLGYVDPLEGADRFSALRLNGTVVSTDPTFGSVTIRDEAGALHTLYRDAFTFTTGGAAVGFGALKPGAMVSVEGRTIRF